MPDEYCLGLEALGRCAALGEPLFSIGEAVAVAALLLAFHHFGGPLIRMRLRSRGIADRTVLILVSASVALVFVAAALRLFGPPWTRVPVIGYPASWEIVAGVVLALAGIALAVFAFTPARLRASTAGDFLSATQGIIASGNDASLRALGHEITPSIALVAGQCRTYRDREKREGPIEADAYTRVCFSLLDTWADRRFCNTLVCWCPDTVTTILNELTEHAEFGDGAPLGSELVNQAYSDERSLLYREARQSGLRRQKVFLKAAFGEWALLDGAVRPLASWDVFAQTAITERKVQRWSDAVDTALGTFLDKGRHGVAVFRIRQGLETLNQLGAWVLADRARRGAPWSSIQGPMFEIAGAFRTVIKRIRTSNLSAPVETTIENYDPMQDETLHGAIAEELFNFFGAVCASDDHTFLDWVSMAPWKELFEEGELTSNLRALQVRVAYYLTLKVDDNLDLLRRFRPAITRMLLVRYPLAAPDEHARGAIARALDAYFIDALGSHFPAMWKAHRSFAESLLPDNVDYDAAEAVLRIRHERRDMQTVRLEATDIK